MPSPSLTVNISANTLLKYKSPFIFLHLNLITSHRNPLQEMCVHFYAAPLPRESIWDDV